MNNDLWEILNKYIEDTYTAIDNTLFLSEEIVAGILRLSLLGVIIEIQDKGLEDASVLIVIPKGIQFGDFILDDTNKVEFCNIIKSIVVQIVSYSIQEKSKLCPERYGGKMKKIDIQIRQSDIIWDREMSLGMWEYYQSLLNN